MKRLPLILALSSTVICAHAQDLRTEITVDRTVQPVLRDMQRIGGVVPVIPAPGVTVSTIEAAEYTEPGIIESQIGVLPAAAWADSIPHTPYRGYASVGYLPLYNLEANVGYRLIDTRKLSLGMWLQYDGNSYNGDIPYFDDALFTTHTATIGGNLAYHFSKNSFFTGDGYATYRNTREPYYFSSIKGDEFRRSYQQISRDIYGHGRWSSRTGQVAYALDGALQYFILGNDRPATIRTSRNSVVQAYGSAALSVGLIDDNASLPWLGVNASFQMMRSTLLPSVINGISTAFRTDNLSLLSLKPYVCFDNESGLKGRVGVNVGIGSGYCARTTIAPDILVSWTPIDFFSAYAKIDGGQYFNRMSQLMEQNPYLDPGVAFGNTNMPIILRGGFNVGPFEGMEVGVSGGYAKARDLLSPLITIQRIGLMVSSMSVRDVDSWFVGAHLGYSYLHWFSLAFDIKYGEADSDVNSWYEWIDAPKVTSSVKLDVHPMPKLDLSIAYNLRYDRKAKSIVYPYNEVSNVIYTGIPNLGTVNDVNISGVYQVTDRISAFVKLENILSCHYKLVSGMPAQGIHGIIGASYKF